MQSAFLLLSLPGEEPEDFNVLSQTWTGLVSDLDWPWLRVVCFRASSLAPCLFRRQMVPFTSVTRNTILIANMILNKTTAAFLCVLSQLEPHIKMAFLLASSRNLTSSHDIKHEKLVRASR